ncbi:hypothetical protein DFP83_1231 [Idiomarina fontislapidosi]|uniref:Uncharacterized protein n=1 Tax=Idiomarina fontislapidosi TaxID=263723 RepID=A0A432XJ12_9GAMM|nr:hypothetical protein [Idiomarina fontislapidosi]PYE30182.1 hypothetical protein DFP83_1231 [Idiomarina fontislapidosi]RUO48622.1 hypothetical protein CWE25_13225 [Idiomarina fontislapidosi]
MTILGTQRTLAVPALTQQVFALTACNSCRAKGATYRLEQPELSPSHDIDEISIKITDTIRGMRKEAE